MKFQLVHEGTIPSFQTSTSLWGYITDNKLPISDIIKNFFKDKKDSAVLERTVMLSPNYGRREISMVGFLKILLDFNDIEVRKILHTIEYLISQNDILPYTLNRPRIYYNHDMVKAEIILPIYPGKRHEDLKNLEHYLIYGTELINAEDALLNKTTVETTVETVTTHLDLNSNQASEQQYIPSVIFRGVRTDHDRFPEEEYKWVEGFYFRTPLTPENFDAGHFGDEPRHCIADKNGVVFEVEPDTVELIKIDRRVRKLY